MVNIFISSTCQLYFEYKITLLSHNGFWKEHVYPIANFPQSGMSFIHKILLGLFNSMEVTCSILEGIGSHILTRHSEAERVGIPLMWSLRWIWSMIYWYMWQGIWLHILTGHREPKRVGIRLMWIIADIDLWVISIGGLEVVSYTIGRFLSFHC